MYEVQYVYVTYKYLYASFEQYWNNNKIHIKLKIKHLNLNSIDEAFLNLKKLLCLFSTHQYGINLNISLFLLTCI